jgi:hypothetical protein
MVPRMYDLEDLLRGSVEVLGKGTSRVEVGRSWPSGWRWEGK